MKNTKKHYSNNRKVYGKKNRKSFYPHYGLPKDLVVIKGDKFIISFKNQSEDESTLWKQVGEEIVSKAEADLFEEEPKVIGDISVSRNGETAIIEAKEYGDGKKHYKMLENGIKTNLSHYDEKLLRRVNVHDNSHSFYDLVPNSMGPFTFDIGARYGVIGAEGDDAPKVLKKPYAPALYWLNYYTKLSEGYTDETEFLESEDDLVDTLFASDVVEDEDDAAIQLYERLTIYAKQALESFNIDWLSGKAPYTKKQVEKCWSIWGELYNTANTLNDEEDIPTVIGKYNNLIVDMIKFASPTFKRGVTVKSFLIKPLKKVEELKQAFEKDIEKWEERINAMEAVMAKPKTAKGKKIEVQSPFGYVGIKKATVEETDHIKELVARCQPSMTNMVKQVWIVDPTDRKEKYMKALEQAEDKTEKELFHGSRNANMVSLLSSGGPNVRVGVANGRMYGNGSYWSDDFDKSLGYTSYRGSRWSHGNDEVAYMLVSKVHYGKPLIENRWDGSVRYEKAVKEGGYDCLHAKAGVSLKRDEIITYDDEHSYVEAIIEIGA